MSKDNVALSCKVVILGESGVGKTCIINRYINDSFNPESMTTSGASYASKTMYFNSYEKNMNQDLDNMLKITQKIKKHFSIVFLKCL